MKKLGKFGVAFVAIALCLAVVGAGFAYFSDMAKGTITTTNSEVKIGALTGFPLDFDNLTPCVWTDWQTVTLASASTIDMDVYIGLQSKNKTGEADLKDMLDVQIQRWDGGWVTVYSEKALGLFATWQKAADDMPAGNTDSYRVRVHLSEDAGNDLQGGWTQAWVLIYGAQGNGPAPTGSPWDYTPLP